MTDILERMAQEIAGDDILTDWERLPDHDSSFGKGKPHWNARAEAAASVLLREMTLRAYNLDVLDWLNEFASANNINIEEQGYEI